MSFTELLKRSSLENGGNSKLLNEIKKSKIRELYGVDLITLNRWISAKTKPSIHKQLLLCVALNIDISELICGMDLSEIIEVKKEVKFIDGFNDKINNSHLSLNYTERPESTEVIFETLSEYLFIKKMMPYLNNFSINLELKNRIGDAETIEKISMFSFVENKYVVGHVFFIDKLNNISAVLGLDENIYADCIGIGPTFYADSKIFWLIIEEFMIYFIDNRKYKTSRYGIALLRGKSSVSFHEDMSSGKFLNYFKPFNPKHLGDNGLYLIEIDLLKLLSKTFVLKMIQRRLLNS